MKQKVYSFILYLLSVLLVAEWIYPFVYLTDLKEARFVIIYVMISLAAYFIGLRFYVTLPLNVFMLYLLSGIYFYHGKPLSPGFINFFIQAIKSGFVHFISFDASKMGMIFVTLIFFVALWLLNYIIAYSILKKRPMTSLLVLTIIYVIIVHTFTAYNGTSSLICTIIVGFLILHFSLAMRLKTLYSKSSAWYHLFVVMTLMFILLIALILPKQTPFFANSLPFIKGLYTGQTVGYSEDDSQLGGSLKNDDREVFRVKSDHAHYYRVEEKAFYTGKGWRTSQNQKAQVFKTNDKLPLKLNENAQSKTEQVDITFANSNNYLVYPYGTQQFNTAQQAFHFYSDTEKFTLKKPIKHYTLLLNEPIYDIDKMKQANYNNLSTSFLTQYTQLPRELPKRVRNLAAEITKNAKTTYDATKAIENYLSLSGKFTYSIKNAKKTLPNADYVDQFLFETKVGYCNDFSTSMVILLRSVDIPARWAKGFTTGSKLTTNDGKTIYRVANNNAHSWPEVYFPGTGWVPFEPTTTFANPERFMNTVPAKRTNDSTNKNSASAKKNSSSNKAKQQPKENKSAEKKAGQLTLRFSTWLWVPVILFALFLLLVILFGQRIKLFLFKKQLNNPKTTFDTAYLSLLSLLEKGYLKRKKVETLTNYAKHVDQYYQTNRMTKLTARYEDLVYGKVSVPFETYRHDFHAMLLILKRKRRN
ncbi:transglutaminase family protein [Listeria sp. PSOL-1]|uniref:transglutaminase-like domain-containing protein n=1 Tax=Listeria sp. PSOL-1 TaxID=1844999 RepID=UPI0013D60557|nr:transglutaminase-like domain-containing protein [Listeria sp. PSOL-1]